MAASDAADYFDRPNSPFVHEIARLEYIEALRDPDTVLPCYASAPRRALHGLSNRGWSEAAERSRTGEFRSEFRGDVSRAEEAASRFAVIDGALWFRWAEPRIRVGELAPDMRGAVFRMVLAMYGASDVEGKSLRTALCSFSMSDSDAIWAAPGYPDVPPPEVLLPEAFHLTRLDMVAIACACEIAFRACARPSGLPESFVDASARARAAAFEANLDACMDYLVASIPWLCKLGLASTDDQGEIATWCRRSVRHALEREIDLSELNFRVGR